MMRCLLLGLGLLLVASGLNAGTQAPPFYRQPIDLSWFTKAVAESDELVVYEGLPHPGFEKADYEIELLRVPVFAVDKQMLYQRALAVEEADRGRLRTIFHDGEAWVKPMAGEYRMKLCGGFHADFAVGWLKKKDALAYALICFGCHEIRFVDRDHSVTTDLVPRGYADLRNILKEYRQERPVPGRDKRVKALKPPPPPLPKVEYLP